MNVDSDGGMTCVADVGAEIPAAVEGRGRDWEGVSEAIHLRLTLEATGLAAASPPFIRLARLSPVVGGAASLAVDPPHFPCAISRSSFAVASRSSSVGPVPTRLSRGAFLPPPMNEASEGADPSEVVRPPDARARMLSLDEAVSRASSVESAVVVSFGAVSWSAGRV